MIHLGRICCVLLAAWPAAAAAGSFVVLNRSAENSLVRVSSDGHLISIIAAKAGGRGLTKDSAGDYIVAAVSSLLRVTPSGSVTTIATAPRGSQWVYVVQDHDGVFVVADNEQHALWRISADGQSVAKLANYSVSPPQMEDVSIVFDQSGNYLVMTEKVYGAYLWRITQSGQVTPTPMRGKNITAGGFMIDATNGDYLIGSNTDRAVFRLSKAGDVTKFAELELNKTALTGMAQNSETGEIVGTLNFAQSLIRISADGRTVSRLVKDPSYLSYPTAILYESEN
jgi:uncharacterized protein YjiK